MRSFFKTALPALVIGLFLVAGCGKDDSSSGPVNTSPVGTWKVTEAGQTMTVVVAANNTFTMDLSGVSTMSGTYVINGNKTTFTYTSCTLLGSPIDCDSPDVGTVSGNTMTIPNGDGTTTTLTRQ